MYTLTLREHQIDLADALRSSLQRNHRTVVCGATGVGKTRLAKWILGRAAERNPNGKYGFFVQRRGLVDNGSDSFLEAPKLSHGMIMSQRDTRGSAPVQVGSIDTLLSWYVKKDRWQYDYTFDILIYDETHSNLPKLIKIAAAQDMKRHELGLPQAYYIGLSATPDCKGIGWYDDIVYGPSPQWLQDNGYAAKFTYYGGKSGNLDKLKKRGGEFTKDSVADAMDGLSGELVRDWLCLSERKPTVGFFPRLSHAKDAQAALIAAGIKAEYVDGDTSDEERRRIFKALDNLEIEYICNVGVIERGTDIGVGCVQLCTAVGSVSRYCLDDQTEILTPEGWKGMESDFSEAYQVDQDLKCSVSPVLDRTERDSGNDAFYGIHGKSLDVLVTEQHRMLTSVRRSGAGGVRRSVVKVCQSEEMPAECKIPVSCFTNSEGIPLTDDEIRFIGLVATDGSINSSNNAICIYQSEQHADCIEYIENVLRANHFRFGKHRIRNHKGSFKENHRRWCFTVSRGDPLRKADRDKGLVGWHRLDGWLTKKPSTVFQDATRNQILVLIEAMIVGDGDKHRGPSVTWNPRTIRLAMADSHEADALQSLFVRNGIRCNKTDNGCGCTCLLVDTTRQWWSMMTSSQDGRDVWERKEHSGRVWCITVETGFIIARRNGKPFIAGNCQMIGRGSRINEHAQDCIVIDHGGNVERHGFWEDERVWTLDRSESNSEESKARPSIECSKCGRIYRGGRCLNCQTEPSPKELSGAGLEFDGSELRRIEKVDKKKSVSSEDVMISALYAAGRSGRTVGQAIHIATSIAKKKRVENFKIPKTITVSGKQHEIPSFGDPNLKLRTNQLFAWTDR